MDNYSCAEIIRLRNQKIIVKRMQPSHNLRKSLRLARKEKSNTRSPVKTVICQIKLIRITRLAKLSRLGKRKRHLTTGGTIAQPFSTNIVLGAP